MTNRILNKLIFIIADFMIVFLMFSLPLFGIKDTISDSELGLYLISISSVALLEVILMFIFKQYSLLKSSFGILSALKMLIISEIPVVVGILVIYLVPSIPTLPIQDIVYIILCSGFLIVSIRFVKRLIDIYAIRASKTKFKRTLIIGCGSGGKMVLDEIGNNAHLENRVIIFVDDDEKKIGNSFSNIPVVGPISNTKEFVEKYKIEEIIIAIADLDDLKLHDILNYVQDLKVRIKRIPMMSELSTSNKMRVIDVEINDLLSREPIKLTNPELETFIKDEVVMVTGAGGSIGSELVRQIFRKDPKTLILLDIYENSTYDIQQKLFDMQRKGKHKNVQIITLIASTYNLERMEHIFENYKPHIVFHAAAYKHVPLMEDSPEEAIRTNACGTYNVAKLSDKYKVKKMVLVSTDKAVRPTNVMGATKAFAELIIKYFSSISKTTSYSAVRFGNVLGSNGSVIPLFKRQIQNGGPVTVTDPNMTRFFMTIPEAVGLILQSAVYAVGGEIFILDMGKPVKIIDLAEKMIIQSGFIPYNEIKIEFVGLRPGEKMYEELLLDIDNQIKTNNDKIYIEKDVKVEDVESYLIKLSETFKMNDNDMIKDTLKNIIPSYQNNK